MKLLWLVAQGPAAILVQQDKGISAGERPVGGVEKKRTPSAEWKMPFYVGVRDY